MTLLYFAWVRQKIGKGEEQMKAPVGDVAGLIAHLKNLGPNYADAFADLSRIRVAVNQHHVSLDAEIGSDDEVAFFPPVTGG
ncbi:MAG TPA: molybdopterin converting factor subunit 1 [Rhizomicrobium sp.]|nr:molybdopterin converting factor subunit 1 [Rhizomicrobium sp.]